MYFAFHSIGKKRKRSEDPKPGQDYITFVSPAGVLPCAEKS